MIAAAFAASTIAASGAIITFDPGATTAARGDGPVTTGNLIRVGGTDITINALGVQDVGGDGLFAPATVAIWTGDGATQLGTVTIPANLAGATSLAGYSYLALPGELVLTANTDYIIGVTIGNGIEFYLDAFPDVAYAGDGVSLVEARFASTLGNAPDVNATGPGGRWAPANATFLVPEPSSAALLGLAGISLLLRRRR